MAVYKGDTQEEIDATDAYNMALQTLAESSVPLAAGGDFASTIRKNWPVGQMKFERGGYATEGYVRTERSRKFQFSGCYETRWRKRMGQPNISGAA